MLEVAMTPLFSAMGGLGSNMGLIVMIVLYSLILIAVWLNRLEGASQGAELILPSGQRLQVAPQLPGQTSLSDEPGDGGNARRLFAENVWDWGFQELRWWQQIGALIVVLSLAYGVGIVVFGMLYPASQASARFAPYAFLNGLLMMVVLVVGSPSRPKERRGDERDDAERFAAAFSSMRYIEPARQQEWTPERLPSPGLELSYQHGEKLAYQIDHSRHAEALAPQLHMGALFATLFLSSLIAPLLAGMVIGGLVLLKLIPSLWMLPLFAWTSGGLTLLFAVGSFLFLRKHAQAPLHAFENSELVFDFEEKNLYAKQGEALRSYHFSQCSALLLDATSVPGLPDNHAQDRPETNEPHDAGTTDEAEDIDTTDDSSEDAETPEARESEAEGSDETEEDDELTEAGGASEAEADDMGQTDALPTNASEVQAFQLYAYGAALPVDGLLLASFVPAGDVGEGEAHATSLGFAATLAKGMKLPLFASHDFPG